MNLTKPENSTHLQEAHHIDWYLGYWTPRQATAAASEIEELRAFLASVWIDRW